ncbi:alpha/beta hydrolase [Butyrivibrio sp. FCS014]|uniref:alpha/beta hydrolase n=1 Tax=Butyrivibrio sp. FCS014 TaxID=1408304 RepID=UPI000463AB60|nr:alpha/beta hydrolase [Butyrivibrio sp. FCS014]
MTDIYFLGEGGFFETMETENEAWFRDSVKQGTLDSFDGTRLRYYFAVPESPRAIVTLVHGMAEFFGKYREYAWYLYQAGFGVYFMEQRGHGYSEGKAPQHDVICIDSYDTYVEDLKCFTDNVVKPAAGSLPMLLIAHSMGGCVGALFLEKYPEVFKAAILSSPMFKMKGANYPAILQFLIGLYAKIFGKEKELAPGQKHFDPFAKLEVSSAVSRPRFEYQLRQRRNNENYQTTGASFSWALASMKATARVIKFAKKITTPVTVMTAGQDHLIDPAGYEAFKAAVPSATFHHYENSRHEIFNSDETTRKQYFEDVLKTLDSYVSQ